MKFSLALAVAALVGTASAQTEQRLGSIESRYSPMKAPVDGGNDWYEKSYAQYQHPENIHVDGNHFTMTIMDGANNAKMSSKQFYTSGRFSIRMKSAAQMPGTVTAFYLASGDGRSSDEAIGTQDELDFEIKGNTPNEVQTNVFMDGEESNAVTFVGNTAAEYHTYGFNWNADSVDFEIDGAVVRHAKLHRPLKPMQMSLSIWTTYGLWGGVQEWAGVTDWSRVGGQPISAEFEVIEFPN